MVEKKISAYCLISKKKVRLPLAVLMNGQEPLTKICGGCRHSYHLEEMDSMKLQIKQDGYLREVDDRMPKGKIIIKHFVGTVLKSELLRGISLKKLERIDQNQLHETHNVVRCGCYCRLVYPTSEVG